MHAKPGLRVFLKLRITCPGSVIETVILLMNKSLLLLLACLVGCNSSPQNDATNDSQTEEFAPTVIAQDEAPVIFAVPRPNSGKFSTDKATALMPEFFKRSTTTAKTDPLVTEWKSPTQGIRIHVTADDTVEIVDYLGRDLVGLDSIDAALDSTMTNGNERSVLLTSDTEGWASPTKKAVIDALFQPSVQIYLVGNDDG